MLYDWPKLEEKDKYAFFLGGNKPLTVLETAHTDAPNLLVSGTPTVTVWPPSSQRIFRGPSL